jgi:hypothetical protein
MSVMISNAAPLPDLPKAYASYKIDESSLSPDGQYGFIFPAAPLDDEKAKVKNSLIALKPFRVVLELPTDDDGYFVDKSNASFSATWVKDGSAVVVTEGSKWGPGQVFVIPIDHGKPGKIAELTALITQVADPDFKKSKADPFNDSYDFVLEAPDEGWPINVHAQVVVECDCKSNPKGDSDVNSWVGHFHGLWDIAQGKFVEEKFERTFSGMYKE